MKTGIAIGESIAFTKDTIRSGGGVSSGVVVLGDDEGSLENDDDQK